jgi:hypothetical protein
MAPGNEQKGLVSNPFLNPIGSWQNYLINWIEADRGYYENPIKAIVFVQSMMGSLVKSSRSSAR